MWTPAHPRAEAAAGRHLLGSLSASVRAVRGDTYARAISTEHGAFDTSAVATLPKPASALLRSVIIPRAPTTMQSASHVRASPLRTSRGRPLALRVETRRPAAR